jgi:hypothetical protein
MEFSEDEAAQSVHGLVSGTFTGGTMQIEQHQLDEVAGKLMKYTEAALDREAGPDRP